MRKPLKIGAYIRVSTDKQVQVFEGSLDTQKYRMQEFVKGRNKEIHSWGTVIDFYVEEGFSAGTVKRPEYQRMMGDLRTGKINLILVADISRLSRNVHDFSVLLRELEQHGASYMSLKEQFDTTTPAGRLMTNMVVTMAQFEREQTSERVAISTNSRALRGLVNGGRPPLGLERDATRAGVWLVNEFEAEKVRTIFQTFLGEGSLGKAIPVLEELGIKPKNCGKKPTGTSERAWNYQTLWDHLCNFAYVGKREVNKKHRNSPAEFLKPWQQYGVSKATWPAIVSEQTFNSVQDMLKDNRSIERRRIANGDARIFLLSGLLSCAECGRSLSGQSAHGRNVIHRYYGHSDKRVKPSECSLSRIRADEVEQVVLNHFFEVASSDQYFRTIEKKLKTAVEASIPNVELHDRAIRKELLGIEKEINSIFRFQATGGMGTEALSLVSERLEALALRKKEMQAVLLAVESTDKTQNEIPNLVNGLRELINEFKRGFKKATPAMKRRLLRKVMKGIVLTSRGLEISFHVEDQIPDLTGLYSNVVELKRKNAGPEGVKSELSLLSGELPVIRNGWGSRI
jgi:site-specific DNA recombinase